ncbi:MAG: hypothetical protein K0Q43_109 [Ramlibacter sp.]|jgi:hypothetical protein|nr:hypothetical protein [Ramlibacter sp.]
MRVLASLTAAFALGAGTATVGALAIAHQASVSAAEGNAAREAQTAALLRVAENALRNPLLLAAAESLPVAAVDAEQGAAAAVQATIAQAPQAAPPPSAASAARSMQLAHLAKPPLVTEDRPKGRPGGSDVRPREVRAQATAAGGATSALAPAPATAVVAAAQTPAPPAADIARVLASVPVEGVSFDKAAVAKLERGAVHLRDGRQIPVGGSFPSGEKLLAIDPDNSRIITNQRQILLFGQQASH